MTCILCTCENCTQNYKEEQAAEWAYDAVRDELQYKLYEFNDLYKSKLELDELDLSFSQGDHVYLKGKITLTSEFLELAGIKIDRRTKLSHYLNYMEDDQDGLHLNNGYYGLTAEFDYYPSLWDSREFDSSHDDEMDELTEKVRVFVREWQHDLRKDASQLYFEYLKEYENEEEEVQAA